jgi:hypothetical protein
VLLQTMAWLHRLAVVSHGKIAYNDALADVVALTQLSDSEGSGRSSEFTYELGGRQYKARPLTVRALLPESPRTQRMVAGSAANVVADVAQLVASVSSAVALLVAERTAGPRSSMPPAEQQRVRDMIASSFAQSDELLARPLAQLDVYMNTHRDELTAGRAEDVVPTIVEANAALFARFADDR